MELVFCMGGDWKEAKMMYCISKPLGIEVLKEHKFESQNWVWFLTFTTVWCTLGYLTFPSPNFLLGNWSIKPHLAASLEKATAPHSSTLAWKVPWMEEPGRLQSMGSVKVRHDWLTSLSLFTFMNWRRKWQPTPVFFPGESQGQGSLVGWCLWGRTESDTTEVT